MPRSARCVCNTTDLYLECAWALVGMTSCMLNLIYARSRSMWTEEPLTRRLFALGRLRQRRSSYSVHRNTQYMWMIIPEVRKAAVYCHYSIWRREVFMLWWVFCLDECDISEASLLTRQSSVQGNFKSTPYNGRVSIASQHVCMAIKYICKIVGTAKKKLSVSFQLSNLHTVSETRLRNLPHCRRVHHNPNP